MSKYTEPCPCCGQPKPRAPTLQERVEDIIQQAISDAIGNKWNQISGWPGTNSIMRHIVNSLADAGIGLVDAAKESGDEHP
jgi:hypothetical protein